MANAFRYTACYISGTQPPAPTATLSGSTLTSSAGAAGATYQWYKDGVPISGATSQTYTPTENGSYQVQVLDSYTCASALSAAVAYSGSATGVGNISAGRFVQLFPNPTTGIVNIVTPLSGDYTVSVYDAYGRTLIITKNATMLDLSDYSSGMYYVTVKRGDMQATERISVIK